MISSQVIQKTLEELRTITRIDLCVMDVDGKVNSTTFPVENEDFGDVSGFCGINGGQPGNERLPFLQDL